MLPGKCVWKPLVQLAVTGQARRFRLTNREPNWPASLRYPGLYLHVPFCKNLCPYCPYHRIEYSDPCFDLYECAVRQEIDLYAPRLAGTRFSSLYIGGGTPTVNWPGLLCILAHLADTLDFHGDICIELHPASMADDCLHALVDAGATMVSIGVESTHDRTLAMIGRSHDGAAALDAVRRAVRAGFKAVNVDLMFALPGQAVDDWRADVRAVLDCGADQLSTYPMFAFPYSDSADREASQR